ncbi:hypothetical protein ACLJK8_08800 [Amaricoccus sp. W119]
MPASPLIAHIRRHGASAPAASAEATLGGKPMHSIIYIVGLVVIVLAILSFVGLG